MNTNENSEEKVESVPIPSPKPVNNQGTLSQYLQPSTTPNPPPKRKEISQNKKTIAQFISNSKTDHSMFYINLSQIIVRVQSCQNQCWWLHQVYYFHSFFKYDREKKYTCPVCNQSYRTSYIEFCSHLDQCLNNIQNNDYSNLWKSMLVRLLFVFTRCFIALSSFPS